MNQLDVRFKIYLKYGESDINVLYHEVNKSIERLTEVKGEVFSKFQKRKLILQEYGGEQSHLRSLIERTISGLEQFNKYLLVAGYTDQQLLSHIEHSIKDSGIEGLNVVNSTIERLQNDFLGKIFNKEVGSSPFKSQN
ncbi:hypothetical protein AM598_20020 [Paenibacillus polymyxa]|nr:hypothetical protein AM598_20020 [Paenibacillus polymyxa]